MLELTDAQAAIVQWGAVLLWTLTAGAGVIDAAVLWMINREAYRVAVTRADPPMERLGALGDVRRSRWFLFAFALALAAGVLNAAWRFLDPPLPDASWRGAFFTYAIVAMLVCFRMAKRADTKTLKEQEAWLAEEPEGDRGGTGEGRGP